MGLNDDEMGILICDLHGGLGGVGVDVWCLWRNIWIGQQLND